VVERHPAEPRVVERHPAETNTGRPAQHASTPSSPARGRSAACLRPSTTSPPAQLAVGNGTPPSVHQQVAAPRPRMQPSMIHPIRSAFSAAC
jgi:hypothetical protein